MVSVLSSQLFIAIMAIAAFIAISLEAINALFRQGKPKWNYSLSFIKWTGLIFIILLLLSNSWNWLTMKDSPSYAENSVSSPFWLFEFGILLSALLYSQLLWIKTLIDTKLARILWCLVILIVVLFSPFIDGLFLEYSVWLRNEADLYLSNSVVNSYSNAAGITITSSKSLYVPAVILVFIITAVGVLISRKIDDKPSQSVS